MEIKCSNCTLWQISFNIDKDGYADCENDKGIRIKWSADDDQGLNMSICTHKDFYCKEFIGKE